MNRSFIAQWRRLLLAMLLVVIASGVAAVESSATAEGTAVKPRNYFERPYFNAERFPPRVDPKSPKKHIVDQEYEVIETGLEPMSTTTSGFGDVGKWVNDHLILFNALQEVPDANAKRLQRVVLFDTNTGKSKTLVPEGRVYCWSSELEIVSIAPLIYTRDTEGRLYHLGNDGVMSELGQLSDVDSDTCRSKGAIAPLGKGTPLELRESDGYILKVREVRAGNVNNIDHATWFKPGQTPVILPIRGSEISDRRYLPFLQKYLLNSFDSQNNGRTDKRLAGANWNRPYDLTPYRLLARDGSIEEIPYPTILFSYGIEGFAFLLPMKTGIAIQRGYEILLLQGSTLVRAWDGHSKIPGLGRSDAISGLTPSPDGCQLAFRRFADWRSTTKTHITILNLCKAK